MTMLRLERITGYRIERLPPKEKKVHHYAAYRADGTMVAQHQKPTQNVALKGLSEIIYRIHSSIIMDQQGWRCNECGGARGLQIHHRVFRSHGRDDRLSNLEALCSDCHARKHGERRCLTGQK